MDQFTDVYETMLGLREHHAQVSGIGMRLRRVRLVQMPMSRCVVHTNGYASG